MRKPVDLRRHLTAALPELRRNPERLMMFVMGGTVRATATRALAWQYEYTLRLVLADWAAHADTVVAPLLAWLRVHQNDMLANHDRKGIRFEAEYLNATSMDLAVDVDLTESVVARPRVDNPQALDLHHLDDRPPLHMPAEERWQLYIAGEKVADWDYPADPA